MSIYEAYKNFICGLVGIFIYIAILGFEDVTLTDFCCANIKLKGWKRSCD